MTSITPLGHATLIVEHDGQRILVDPWLAGNPACPPEHHEPNVDAILVTHAHGDHIGDLFTAHTRCRGPVVGIYDLTTWLETKGVPAEKLVGMNLGGTIAVGDTGVRATMVRADHSASFVDDGVSLNLGVAAGYIVHAGAHRIYIAGDTDVFGDMALLKARFAPTIAVLPIGDHFTMGPEGAALACELLGVPAVIPYHYGTFGLLHGTPTQLEEAIAQRGGNTVVHHPTPGSAIPLD
jgi:L-ascorbate metabolism protein UlaG (beta-lactamase superfamily)